jgi:hypothetical protein
MISDFPEDFLKIFTTIYGQFITFTIILSYIWYNSDEFDIYYILTEAIFAVIILQIIKKIVFYLFSSSRT